MDKNGSKDLAIHVETKEGIKFQFTPNRKGLQVLDYKDHFGVGKDGCVFGKEICVPADEEEPIHSNSAEDIATVEGNNKNFTDPTRNYMSFSTYG